VRSKYAINKNENGIMAKKNNKAKRSAAIVTAVRALGFYDKDAQNPDSMANLFLSKKFKMVVWLLRIVQMIGKGFLERSAPGFYWYFQVRTKHLDVIFEEAINTGIEQLVILGAGYDSRPYRFREKLNGIRIFELDFPGTLSFKKQKLLKLYSSLPKNVTYIPIDFNSQSIKDVLFESGYDADKKTFFIWEGVSYYLPNKSFDAVLEFVAKYSQPNSSIAFDYAIRSFIEGDYSTYGAKKLAETWEKMGEPGLSGIEDGATDRFLRERGLRIISDLGSDNLEKIYATNNNGEQIGRIWGCMRIVYASVIGS
jgi:methyltransferase (TIGR00027 family)